MNNSIKNIRKILRKSDKRMGDQANTIRKGKKKDVRCNTIEKQ